MTHDKTDKMVRPDTILKYGNSIFAPLAMRAGMQLEIFTALKDGPRSAEQVKETLGLKAPAPRVEMLLDALVAAGLLERVDDRRFRNTAESDTYLVKGKPNYMGGLHSLYSELWPSAFHTAETLTSGQPQAAHDYAAMDRDALYQYYANSFPGAVAGGRALARLVDFSAVEHLADMGGGHGGLSVGLCEAHDHLKATVVDFPTTTPFTQEFVKNAGLDGRIDTVDCDLVHGVPEGEYDGAVMRNVLQVLSNEDAARAVRNMARAIKSGGLLVVWGWALDDDRLHPQEGTLHNLVFLNFYPEGKAHTESEYRTWLLDAGFTEFKRAVQPGGLSLITARKG